MIVIIYTKTTNIVVFEEARPPYAMAYSAKEVYPQTDRQFYCLKCMEKVKELWHGQIQFYCDKCKKYRGKSRILETYQKQEEGGDPK